MPTRRPSRQPEQRLSTRSQVKYPGRTQRQQRRPQSIGFSFSRTAPQPQPQDQSQAQQLELQLQVQLELEEPLLQPLHPPSMTTRQARQIATDQVAAMYKRHDEIYQHMIYLQQSTEELRQEMLENQKGR